LVNSFNQLKSEYLQTTKTCMTALPLGWIK
jgi:hypothetical protein